MFLRNCWYVAAWDHELDSQKLLARRILDQTVLLYRTSQGLAVALKDQCPHRLVPLSAGRRCDDMIQCGYHGLVFAADGRCVEIPGQAGVPGKPKVPDSMRVPVFPTVRRHALVWIWMGAPEAADPALIPAVPWLDQTGWEMAGGYTHIAADYRLLTDNLLDLSHENYLHEGTIGNEAEETIADYPPVFSLREDQVLSVRREMLDIEPPPFFSMILASKERIDRWQTAIWTAPTVNITDTKAQIAGDKSGLPYLGRVVHLLTPETACATHYFWSLSRNCRLADEALSESLREALKKTFDEDKAMLELQQKALSDSGLSDPNWRLRVDQAPEKARQILASLIQREQDRQPHAIVSGALVDGEGIGQSQVHLSPPQFTA